MTNNVHRNDQDLTMSSINEVEAQVNELRKKYPTARNPKSKT